MVLASESKSCFCQNLCEFSIVDHPLSHYEMSENKHHHYQEQQVQSNPQVREATQCNVVASNIKKTEKGKMKTGLHLSLEVLKPHFGKKLENVAKELGVGRSTIKRACRDYGITRWPSNKKKARNASLFEGESTQDHHQEMWPSSSNSLQGSSSNNVQVSDTNVAHTNMESTRHLVVQKEVEKVVIKVKYGEDKIKFELCLSLGVSKLFQEAARRLNLKIGTFKLKYMDEDNEEILIACDDDLQLCAKSHAAMGKTCIQLFVPKQV